MKTCFIHCGPHKTGSTSIQRSLDSNPQLLAAQGLFVPNLSAARNATESHKALIAELPSLSVGEKDKTRHWDLLGRMLGQSDLMPILSSEIFSGHFLKAQTVRAVSAFLHGAGHRVQFIYYVRDHPSWLNSIYVQDSKRFYNTLDFESYVEAALGKPRFDYNRLVRHVLASPGSGLTALPFETSARTGLFGSFLQALGIAPLPRGSYGEAGRENPNAGVKTVHVGLQIATLLAERGLNPRAHRNLYLSLKQAYQRHRWPEDPYCGLDNAMAARISERFSVSNAQFAKAVWGRPWSEVIEPRTEFHRNELDPANRPARDMRDVEKTLTLLRGMVAAIPGKTALSPG